jgi:hypothetical protein
MAKQFDYEVKTTIRLNMHNPDHVLINNVIQKQAAVSRKI